MISEEQKKKYEQDANSYIKESRIGMITSPKNAKFAFIAGAEHAHSDGKKEGWNDAIGKAILLLDEFVNIHGQLDGESEELIAELQKLRK